MTKLKIIQHKEVKRTFACNIGECESPAHHTIWLLGDYITLCDTHFEQCCAEMLNILTDYQNPHPSRQGVK